MSESTSSQQASTSKSPQEGFSAPTPEQLSGTWYVTHSTLPMWSSKRNVTITYTPLAPASDGAPRLDDLVTYQTLTSNKVKTVRGIDTANGHANTGAWNWRGKGWLAIAKSQWAVLTHGSGDEGEQWMVNYFMKTLFTPAGIDILAKSKDGLSGETASHIKQALKEVADRDVRELAGVLFEVTQEGFTD